MSSRVVIIALPDVGDGLSQLAAGVPIWIADTPPNRAAVERIRNGAPGGGTTTFRVDPAGTPDEWTASILGAVVEHHGGRSQEPPVDTLELHGVVVTDALRAALAAHGFTDVTGNGEVMTARVPPAA